MRLGEEMRRPPSVLGCIVATAIATTVLSGCGQSNLSSVLAPSPAQVASYINEQRTAAEAVKGMTPREYLSASIVYSNQRCKEFFISLSESQRDSRLIDKVLQVAQAAGTSLFPVYEISRRSQAMFTAMVGGAAVINEGVREIYAFGPYATELNSRVTEAQNVYLSAQSTRDAVTIISNYSSRELRGQLQTSLSGNVYAPVPSVDFVVTIDGVTRDEAMLLARYIAQGYAYQCSVPNIQNLIRSSIATARIENIAADTKGGMTQAVPSAVSGDGSRRSPR